MKTFYTEDLESVVGLRDIYEHYQKYMDIMYPNKKRLNPLQLKWVLKRMGYPVRRFTKKQTMIVAGYKPIDRDFYLDIHGKKTNIPIQK